LIWISGWRAGHGSMRARQYCRPGVAMKLFQDLFFTDYGLMSFIGIMFMIGMAVFFLRLFTRK
jgi:hypothetical protein